MAVQFQNFDYTYERDGKPIFAPSVRGRKIGDDIKAQIEAAHDFDDFVYHLKKNGGHVAALHAHRSHQYFARVDIKRFFYSVARNSVQRALDGIGIPRARHYAKWSCVKNPYDEPSYALPYGFVQSPILATLVLMQSAVGSYLRHVAASGVVTVSVYMDDISFSSDEEGALGVAFEEVQRRLIEANFEVSANKVRRPSSKMDVFNCDLSQGRTEVQQARIDLFNAEPRSPVSVDGFRNYCSSVEDGNAP
jgi:hypothetical protein